MLQISLYNHILYCIEIRYNVSSTSVLTQKKHYKRQANIEAPSTQKTVFVLSEKQNVSMRMF